MQRARLTELEHCGEPVTLGERCTVTKAIFSTMETSPLSTKTFVFFVAYLERRLPSYRLQDILVVFFFKKNWWPLQRLFIHTPYTYILLVVSISLIYFLHRFFPSSSCLQLLHLLHKFIFCNRFFLFHKILLALFRIFAFRRRHYKLLFTNFIKCYRDYL